MGLWQVPAAWGVKLTAELQVARGRQKPAKLTHGHAGGGHEREVGCAPPAGRHCHLPLLDLQRGVGWQPPDAIPTPRHAPGVDGLGVVRPCACDGPSNESCAHRAAARRAAVHLGRQRVGGGRARRRGSVEEVGQRGGGGAWRWRIAGGREGPHGRHMLNGLGIVAGYRE